MRLDLPSLLATLASLPPAAAARPMVVAGGGTLALAIALLTAYHAWPSRESDPQSHAAAAEVVEVNGPLMRPVAHVPAIPEESTDEPAAPYEVASLVRKVQLRLKTASCLDGPADGRWSRATRRAMSDFADRVNARLPLDGPDEVHLALLTSNPEATCLDQPQGGAAKIASTDAAPAPTPRQVDPNPQSGDVASSRRAEPTPAAVTAPTMVEPAAGDGDEASAAGLHEGESAPASGAEASPETRRTDGTVAGPARERPTSSRRTSNRRKSKTFSPQRAFKSLTRDLKRAFAGAL